MNPASRSSKNSPLCGNDVQSKSTDVKSVEYVSREDWDKIERTVMYRLILERTIDCALSNAILFGAIGFIGYVVFAILKANK